MKKYIKLRWKENILLLILIILGGAFKVLGAYATGNSFNYILKYDVTSFLKYILITGLFLIGFLITLYFKIVYQSFVIQKMMTDIRDIISKMIEKNNYKTLHKYETGSFVSWLNNDLLMI